MFADSTLWVFVAPGLLLGPYAQAPTTSPACATKATAHKRVAEGLVEITQETAEGWRRVTVEQCYHRADAHDAGGRSAAEQRDSFLQARAGRHAAGWGLSLTIGKPREGYCDEDTRSAARPTRRCWARRAGDSKWDALTGRDRP
jgi:hypothetical protein